MSPDTAKWKVVLKMMTNVSSMAFAEVQLRSVLLGRGVASVDVWSPMFRANAAISVLRQPSRCAHIIIKVKQSLYRHWQAQRFPGSWESQISKYSAHENGKVVNCTHRPPSPPGEIFLVLISVKGWVDPQGYSAVGRIISMKNSSNTSGDRTRDLLANSTVPQPTGSTRAPI